MKFLSFLLAVVFVLSFSVTAFADVALEPTDVTFSETETEGTIEYVEDDTLNLVLNEMQSDINTVESKVEVLENEVALLNESNSVSVPPTENAVSEVEEETELNPDLGIDESTPTGVNVYALNPITPEGTTGLKSILLSLIGDYDAIVVEYEFTGSNNYTNYLREVQPDYVWLCSAAIFLVIIYSVFRLGGALFG